MFTNGAMRAIWVITGLGCSAPTGGRALTSSPTPNAQASAELRGALKPTEGCLDPVVLVENGVERGVLCGPEAVAHHGTILDLRDAWTPTLFAPQPDGTAPIYRAQYLALASERDPKGGELASEDTLGELYGVLPSLAIAR
ncbi:MAG: hypothetical protein ABIY55_34915, partial [Kofleriaceae bacterium]